MSITENSTTLLLSEVTQLLDAMILELELRGCQNHHEIVKRAIDMQTKIRQLNNN